MNHLMKKEKENFLLVISLDQLDLNFIRLFKGSYIKTSKEGESISLNKNLIDEKLFKTMKVKNLWYIILHKKEIEIFTKGKV